MLAELNSDDDDDEFDVNKDLSEFDVVSDPPDTACYPCCFTVFKLLFCFFGLILIVLGTLLAFECLAPFELFEAHVDRQFFQFCLLAQI